MQTKKNHFFDVIGITLTSISILAGILAPMFVVMGIIIYFSWFFFGYPFFDWTEYYFYANSYSISLKILIYSIEILSFILGLGLFIVGLVTFLKQKKEMKKSNSKEVISNGIYSIIRHPQNLGISLILFPFVLILPFESIVETVRFGDILSWGLSFYFLALISLHEERIMLRLFAEKYWSYLQQTGFFLPKRRKCDECSSFSTQQVKNYFKREILILSLLYFGFLVGCIGVFFLLKPYMVRLKFPLPYKSFFSFWEKPAFIPFIVIIIIWTLNLLILLFQKVNKTQSVQPA